MLFLLKRIVMISPVLAVTIIKTNKVFHSCMCHYQIIISRSPDANYKSYVIDVGEAEHCIGYTPRQLVRTVWFIIAPTYIECVQLVLYVAGIRCEINITYRMHRVAAI